VTSSDAYADVGAKRIGGEVFFPKPRRELGDAARRVFTHPLQHIDEIGVTGADDANSLEESCGAAIRGARERKSGV